MLQKQVNNIILQKEGFPEGSVNPNEDNQQPPNETNQQTSKQTRTLKNFMIYSLESKKNRWRKHIVAALLFFVFVSLWKKNLSNKKGKNPIFTFSVKNTGVPQKFLSIEGNLTSKKEGKMHQNSLDYSRLVPLERFNLKFDFDERKN